MSKTSEAGIHMYMMKAHELMGVWGCRSRGEFLCFCLQSFFHEYSRGIRGRFMTVHAVFMHSVSVCMWIHNRREKPILLAVLKVSFPFQNNMLHHLCGLLSSFPNQKKKESDEEAAIKLLHEYSSSMGGLIRGWRSLL